VHPPTQVAVVLGPENQVEVVGHQAEGQGRIGTWSPTLVVHPERPGRFEPRVNKRRPKQYPLMTDLVRC
jgi:hypothetical protein